MCGIVGFAGLAQSDDHFPAHLRAMLRAVAHRGPDQMGYYFDHEAGLAAARLAIIDVTHGQQPMMTSEARHILVCNGEIFNYVELRACLTRRGVKFYSNTDTEVLLHALVNWGVDALPRLNGQFAFAFYDRLSKQLVLGRDGFGERPLFYTLHSGGLIFGSEIKALFALPFVIRELSAEGLRQVCHFWTTLGSTTCFKDVYSIPPGHYAIFHEGRFTLRRWHQLPRKTSSYKPHDFPEAKAQLRQAVTESVRRRLRSDAGVAVYLSGGLDSSIVTMLAQQESPSRLHSFSIEFEGQDYDESPYQQQVVERVGTEPHVLRTTRKAIRAALPEVVRHAETALFRTAAAPLFLLSKQVHEHGIKVVLSGEGADEMFLGYDIFKEAACLDQRSPVIAHLSRWQSESVAARLISGDYDSVKAESEVLQEIRQIVPDFDQFSQIERARSLEIVLLLGGYLLSSQGDRMAAAHGVESRYPFLDPEVVQLAYSMPDEFLLQEGRGGEKRVLKAAFSENIPEDILNRPKQPYRAPIVDCLCVDGDDDWIADMLTVDNLKRSSVINVDFARHVIEHDFSAPPQKCGRRYDHVLTLLITTLLLEDIFIRNFQVPSRNIESILLQQIDGRTISTL